MGAELACVVVGVAPADARSLSCSIAETARIEWHEERFSALYLDQTLAGARDVSVLLADLAGFTSFSERHDADDVDGDAERVLRRDRAADGARAAARCTRSSATS